MNAKSSYEQFCWSVFDESVGAQRDGVDLQALAALALTEKNKAEKRILDALVKTNDSRPFIAAGAMKLLTAAPIIKQRLLDGFKKNTADYMTVHAAHALFLIERWPDALDLVSKILQNTPKVIGRQWTRMMAVEALADFPCDSLASAVLFSAVEDEDEFVGFLAVKSLEKMYEQNNSVMALLEKLQETQVEPHRWKPEFLKRRKELFLELQKITGVTMPKVAMSKQKTDVSPSDVPEINQLRLSPSGDEHNAP
jgi:hypothetical protein